MQPCSKQRAEAYVLQRGQDLLALAVLLMPELGAWEVKHHQALALEVLPQLARSRVAPRCGATERCVRSP